MIRPREELRYSDHGMSYQREPDWRDRGLCAEADPELFFPEKNHPEQARAAKSLCQACDERPTCLEWALENDEVYGIWGGLSERERLKIRREQRRSERVAS